MPCRAEILALSALLMQVLPAMAHPAAGGIPEWSGNGNGVANAGNVQIGPDDHDYDYGLPYEYTHGIQKGAGDGPDDHCGGGHGGGGHGGYYPTVTVSDW
ncbi:hypothetical protein F1880_005785 [Penicillium rolfsii]|nr:hypothetical protein F1880_005785 [Penicillium rolfsii]